tara:strand:+ start:338 stop:2059 length:1722 start_codon:yes stop_codon:yes gene_type:complete
MKKIIFLILITTFSIAQTSAPFSNKQEGNDFREWVNENHPKYAKEINLGRSGSHTNSYILKAYKKFGKDYLKEINPAPKINVNAIATKINQKKIKQHIAVLSSDYFEGREVGEPGEEKAAKYISAYFSKIGIPPYNDTTYFQEFKLIKRSFVNIDLQVSGKKYEQNKEYFSFPMFPPSVIKSDEVLFLGYGIETSQYNDYQQDVEGKVIMILQGEPKDKNGNYIVSGSEKKSPKRSWKEKLKTAKKNKAKAVIFISENFDKDYNLYKHRIEHEALNLLIKEDELPFVYINKGVAEKILGRNKTERFKKEISATKSTLNKKIKKSISLATKTKEKIITGKNVLGYIEGSDPELKKELIVITAHYDHIGIIDGEIHNGADDNASGTAGLLEIAATFQLAKKLGVEFKRSILCMPVSAEEKGLLGSYYYAENPEFPLENTIVNLNMDMVGRPDKNHPGNENYIYLIGSDKLSTDLHNTSEKTNEKYVKMELDYRYNEPGDPNRFYYRSDHYNFAKNNIPSIFYFSGIHEDYHKPTDTMEKLSFKKITSLTKLIFFTAWELSNAPKRPVVDKKNTFD